MVHILRIVRKKVRADPLGFLVLCVKQKTEGVVFFEVLVHDVDVLACGLSFIQLSPILFAQPSPL